MSTPDLLPHEPNFGDLFTAEEWSDAVSDGAFIPSDGCGCWATAQGFSDDHDKVFGPKPDWATHVVWFNK
jgi:hypothetical protein